MTYVVHISNDEAAYMHKLKEYEPVREKTNNLGSEQVQHKPGCTVTEDG